MNFEKLNPNKITAIRFCMAPIVFGCLLYPPMRAIAILAMVISEASDIADGYIARKYNKTSVLGKVLDPIADSLYHLTVFLAFAINGWMPYLFLSVFIGRDLISYTFRLISFIKKSDPSARKSGKIKAWAHGICQIGTVLLFWLFGRGDVTNALSLGLIVCALMITIVSGIDYLRQTGRVFLGNA